VCASDVADAVAYKVERLEAKPGSAMRKVIAVLDDDHDLTNTICAHLDESGGYEARPFYKTADLLSGVKMQRFDGFVIDWIVGETSTLKLIAALRAQDAACPIIVLTAQVLSGVVDEADIAEAVKTFDLVFSEKPVRMSILSATLSRAFASAASRATS
jgi:FixJ family two-component response regulator